MCARLYIHHPSAFRIRASEVPAGLGIWLGRVLRPGSASERGGFFLGRRESRAAPEPGGQGPAFGGPSLLFVPAIVCASHAAAVPPRGPTMPLFSRRVVWRMSCRTGCRFGTVTTGLGLGFKIGTKAGDLALLNLSKTCRKSPK